MVSSRSLAALLALVLGGCTGVIQDAGGAGSTDAGTSSADPGSGAPGAGAGEAPGALDCDASEPALLPLRLRRLTNLEYRRSVQAVFGDAVPEADAFVSDEKEAGFAANGVAAISDVQLERYVEAAHAVGERIASQSAGRLSGCAPSDTPCAQTWIEALATRAYRRPPSADELSELQSRHATFAAEWGDADADRLIAESLLLAPQFLYHAPFVTDAEHALAARVSYFLTSGPPDDVLLGTLANADLFERSVLEAEVRRLYASEAGQVARRSFFEQWLALERLELGEKDVASFPEWSETLRASMLEEVRLFTEHVAQGGGGLKALLSSNIAFVDAPLAALYGVSDRYVGPGFQQLELPATERAGILTQAGFLAGHAHQRETSWVLRGEFVRRHLLCQDLPPPPGDIDTSVGNDTSREAQPACWGCHVMMDPIGQSFDRYDALGRYDAAAAAPPGDVVDVEAVLDVGGAFGDPVELGLRLSESRSVSDCVALNVYRFAHRRRERPEEACAVRALQEAFAGGSRDLGELMVATALSATFVREQEAP